MKTVIVYESMYGNTHQVAECIGEAARVHGEAVVVSVAAATADVIADADVLIVGGPTHVHGMTSTMSRRGAVDDAPKKHLQLERDADGLGLREWFEHLSPAVHARAVAFDTRFDGPLVFTGRASKSISKRLSRHGCSLLAEPESFLVDKENHLVDGETDRARRWAAEVLEAV
jgi:flavodoxin